MYLYLENKETNTLTEYSFYRKFNALQGYFENNYNIENGRKVLLDINRITKIYNRLNEIRYVPERGSELLPTQSGPFHGTYEYDHLYHAYVNQASTDFYHAKYIDFKSTIYI